MSTLKTSEAKLLDIIKKKTKPGFQKKAEWNRFFNNRFAQLLQKKNGIVSQIKIRFHESPLRLTNQVLMGFCGVAVLILLWGFVGTDSGASLGMDEKKRNTREDPKTEESDFLREEETIDIVAIGRRNLFRPLVAPAPPKIRRTPKKIIAAAPPKIPLSKRASHLSLVGIVTGDSPQAVIEDSKKNKTHYVHAGETIGEIGIQSVGQGKVILSYEGETYALKL